MKRALVEPGGRVAQIVEIGATFPVHEDLQWIAVADDVTAAHRYDGGAFVAPEALAPPAAPRNLAAELDALKKKVAALEAKS